jgi:hypothetical protein
MPRYKHDFDPIAVLETLDEHGVTYIVIGALGRVIHGTGEMTAGIDIVPAKGDKNLRRLSLALQDLNARSRDGRLLALDSELRLQPVVELQTDAGEVKIVPQPAGTRGYNGLHWRANREPLGNGLRPAVASLTDHALMLAALDREQDASPLRKVRRLIEFENNRSRHARRGQRRA